MVRFHTTGIIGTRCREALRWSHEPRAGLRIGWRRIGLLVWRAWLLEGRRRSSYIWGNSLRSSILLCRLLAELLLYGLTKLLGRPGGRLCAKISR